MNRPQVPDPTPEKESPFEELLSGAAEQERRESPGPVASRAFLRRVRTSIEGERIASVRVRRFSRLQAWSAAAVIPLLVALLWAYRGGEVDIPLADTDVAVVRNLEVLEVLEGLGREDLEELDADSIVDFLENLELLQTVDPEMLEGIDEER